MDDPPRPVSCSNCGFFPFILVPEGAAFVLLMTKNCKPPRPQKKNLLKASCNVLGVTTAFVFFTTVVLAHVARQNLE